MSEIRGRVVVQKVSGKIAGGRGPKGDPGGDVMSVGPFTSLSSLSIPVGTDSIVTSSYDGQRDLSGAYVGGATYVETNAPGLTANAYTAQTSNGRWFILAEDFPTIDMFGAVGDAVVNPDMTFPTGTDNTSAISAGVAYCCRTGLINCLTLLVPSRSYLFSSLTINDADRFELRGMGDGSMLASTAGAATSDWSSGFAIKIKDSARCKLSGFVLAGNSNKPDGVVLENNGLHARTTSSMTCNTVWIDFNGPLRGPAIHRCISVIDNQQVMDNNDFNDFYHSRCFNYWHSAVTLASRNSLVNTFPKLVYNSYTPKATSIRYLETLSVMRPLTVGGTAVEQGGGCGVVKSGTRMVFAGGLFGSHLNTDVVAFYLRGVPLHSLQIEGLTIEDQAALLDVDYSTATSADGARREINFVNVELKGGVGDLPSSPLPFIRGKSCAQVPLTLSFKNVNANQGRIGQFQIDPFTAAVWSAGVWTALTASGIPDGAGGYLTGGSLTIIAPTVSPGAVVFDASISSLLLIDFRGNFTYGALASVNGAGKIIEYGDKNLYGNLVLGVAGKTLSFVPPTKNVRDYIQAGDAGPFIHGRANSGLSGAPTTLSQFSESPFNDKNAYTYTNGALSLPALPTRVRAVREEGVWYAIPLYRISNTALFQARANNTGTGTITSLSASGATVGEWVVRMTSATAFNLFNPAGTIVSAGTAGTPLTAGGVSVTVTSGSSAFVTNDAFVITVV